VSFRIYRIGIGEGGDYSQRLMLRESKKRPTKSNKNNHLDGSQQGRNYCLSKGNEGNAGDRESHRRDDYLGTCQTQKGRRIK
jgi:hypothetical protein